MCAFILDRFKLRLYLKRIIKRFKFLLVSLMCYNIVYKSKSVVHKKTFYF